MLFIFMLAGLCVATVTGELLEFNTVLLRLSERIHRSSHSTVQHNELGNVNLEISRSPFVLMSGS